ncbi:MAG TPA: alpha/beta hydrolase [Chloroflexi bacterium]|jgi:pimeloyl-ACP methyl ester carboxylesterase|nr:alpha/beta hydrolase [Chloroflexota bacterium]
MRRLRAGSRWAAAVGILLILLSIVQMTAERRGLHRERQEIDGIPITALRPADATGRLPTVVLVHGFAASSPIMEPLARTFARSGYLAVTYDMRGQGASRKTFVPYDSGNEMDSLRMLVDEMDTVMAHVRGRPDSDPDRTAILGHSLGTAVSNHYAIENPDRLRATLALSTIYTDVRPGAPPNLLLLVGANEPGSFRKNAQAALRNASGDDAAAVDITTGDFGRGTARRMSVVPHVEHATILFSHYTARECLDWLAATIGAGRPLPGAPWDLQILWSGLLSIGALLLFPALAAWLGHVLHLADAGRLARSVGAPLRGLPLLAFAAAGVLAPVLTRWLPWRAPAVMVADYLGPLSLYYGLIAGAVAWPVVRRRVWPRDGVPFVGRPALYLALLFVYLAATVGFALNNGLFVLVPGTARIGGILLLALLFVPAFTVLETVAREHRPLRAWGYWIGGALGWSLALGIGLLLGAPFFLALVFPGWAGLLAIAGYLGDAVYRACRIPLAGAILQALCVGWVLGMVGPLLGR